MAILTIDSVEARSSSAVLIGSPAEPASPETSLSAAAGEQESQPELNASPRLAPPMDLADGIGCLRGLVVTLVIEGAAVAAGLLAWVGLQLIR